jgi:Ser/Thr protein kinase RdoA (MazF antagonist)
MMTNFALPLPETDATDTFREAARAFFPDVERVDQMPASGELARVTTPAGEFALRRWEPAATTARVAFVHAVLERARAGDLTGVPAPRQRHDRPGEAAVLVGGRLYDAQSWLPGRPLHRQGAFRSPDGGSINLPLHPSTPVDAAVADAARLIGRVHTATRELATHSDAPLAPLARMLDTVRDSWREDRRRLGPLAASTTEVRRWLRCGNRVISIASDRLRASPDLLRETSVVTHGDLWPSHLLISDDEITGVVDWARAAAGSALLDLAHLATHVAGWSAARAELVLGAYSETAPLLPEQRRLLPVVAALDLLAEVGWQLGLGFADDRLFTDPALPFVRGGAKTLLTSLETLTDVLAPPEPRSDGRRWVPRHPPRPGDSPRRSATTGPRRPPREGSGRSPRRSPPRRPGRG